MGAMFSTINKQQRVITTRAQLDEEIFLFREDQLISSFLEIAVGQTTETARRFLQTTNWNIEEAINLFLTNDYVSSMYHENHVDDDSTTSSSGTSDDSPSSFEEAKSVSIHANLWLIVNLQSRTSHTLNRDLWSNDDVSQTVTSNFILWQVYDHTIEGQKISSFYKIDSAPPVVLLIDPITGKKMHMWSGMIEAQSFVDDLMNFMNTGPHEHVASLIRNWRSETTETCSSSNNTYQPPAPSEDTYSSRNNMNQVVAPSWGEEFEKEDTYSSRNNMNQVVAPEGFEKVETCSSSNNTDDQIVPPYLFAEEIFSEFPVLTEEPKGDCDRSIVCSLCIRYPDGRRKQRKFLKSEPIQLLWSFCYSHMDASEKKPFKLVQAIPGSSKTLDYEANATFDQSELANSIISVTWE